MQTRSITTVPFAARPVGVASGSSKIEYIDSGLVDLVAQIRKRSIRSIAVRPRGCGKGRLERSNVKPRIVAALSPLRDVRVVLYGA